MVNPLIMKKIVQKTCPSDQAGTLLGNSYLSTFTRRKFHSTTFEIYVYTMIAYIYEMSRTFYICLFALCVCIACKIDSVSTTEPVISNIVNDKEKVKIINDDFPYNLKSPTSEWLMPQRLKEISGLAYKRDSKELVAVNDEKGNFYLINISTGEVVEKVDFGGGGDYEGVEFVNNQVCIVKSNGNIYIYSLGEPALARRVKTRLKFTNNVEGLGYDGNTNSLLLACKDSPNISGETEIKGKAVYSYSLKRNVLSTKPLLNIRDKALLAWSAKNAQNPEKNKKIRNRLKSFSPSGIAVHPSSHHYYILSSKGHLLVVADRKGAIVHIEFLEKEIEQPEGICFDSMGKLYISSEGIFKKGRIFVFEMRAS